MKKTPFTKLFCMLLTLVLLLTPVAAMAEEEVTGVEFSLSNQPRSYRIVKSAGLDTSELYLNSIPYTPQLNPKGDIVMRNIDLTAAQAAKGMIEEYDTLHPDQPFDPEKYLVIISGKGLRVAEQALPDIEEVYAKMQGVSYSPEIPSDYGPALVESLTGLQKTLNRIDGGEEFSDRIASITKDFHATVRSFSRRMFDIYKLLYDIRSEIARELLPQRLLSDTAIVKLISVYRDVLEKCGLKPEELEFWKNDAAWMAHAATYSELKLNASSDFLLSDNKGAGIQIDVTHVWPEPEVPQPPDEFDYEPPMPSPPEPEIPL